MSVRLCWQYYNFTHFTMMLNECRDDVKAKLAPTDSRLRPDMRHLEQGNLGASTYNGVVI